MQMQKNGLFMPGGIGTKYANTTYEVLIRQAYHWLVDEEYMRSRREIRKLDTIDVTGAFENTGKKPFDMPEVDMTDEEYLFLKENWLNAVPPLSKGVVKVNRERYIQFEMEDLSLDNGIYSVILADYSYNNSVWGLGCAGVGLVRKGGLYQTVETAVHHVLGMDDILSKVDPVKVGWAAPDRKYWEETVMANVRHVIEQHKPKDLLEADIALFVLAICRTNYQLSQNQAKALPSKKSTHLVKGIALGESVGKKQIIRAVGNSGITISSAKVPRCPTEEYVRKYKVASWNTRGHVRRLKSGKTVYVRPSVHHRKCMKQNGETAQTVIQVQQTQKEENYEFKRAAGIR